MSQKDFVYIQVLDLYNGLKDKLLEEEILEVIRAFLVSQNVPGKEINEIISKLSKNNEDNVSTLSELSEKKSVNIFADKNNSFIEKIEKNNIKDNIKLESSSIDSIDNNNSSANITTAIVKVENSNKVSLVDKIRIIYYYPGFTYRMLKLNIYEWIHFPKYKFRFFIRKVLDKFRKII